jgi:uncharacterized protein (TIGR02001 family)
MKARIAVAGALLAATTAAGAAEISATATLTSDYDWRGVTQTDGDWAFQLGLNYAGDYGVYMGVWGSNVKVSDPDSYPTRPPSAEIDAYIGYSGGDPEESVGYDFGAIYYGYPNAGELNFPEVYAGINKGAFSLKGWYSWDFFNSGVSAWYADGNVTLPMANNFSFLAHVGYSGGKYHKNVSEGGEYMDFGAGVQFEADEWIAKVEWRDGSDMEADPRNVGRFVFSVATTFSSGE